MSRPPNPVGRTTGSALRALTYGVGAVVGSRGRPANRRSLVFAPAEAGSEGDALLLAGVAALLDSPPWIAGGVGDDAGPELDPGARALVGAAARLPWGLGRSCAWAVGRSLSGAWYVGADMLDGAYGRQPIAALDRLDALRRVGVPTGVCGFSWRPEPDPDARERVRRAAPDTLFIARGECSAERFRATTGRECRVGPDLSWAALLAEIDAGAVTRPTAPAADVPRLGVNLSQGVTGLVRPTGSDPLAEVVTRVVERRHAAGWAVSLIPHDERPPAVSDIAQLVPVARALGLPAGDLQMVRGPALRRRIAACDIVVTGRMHLGISALAHGVPVVALPYLDKFEDLAADPALAPYLRLVDPTAPDVEARIDAALDELLAAGPQPGPVLAALHSRQRAGLRTMADLLAERIASR